MTILTYLKQNYPDGEKTNWSTYVTDGNGRYWADINEWIDDQKELLHEQDSGGLDRIIDYYIDWDALEYDTSRNGELIYLSDLNIQQDEVNEYGELI